MLRRWFLYSLAAPLCAQRSLESGKPGELRTIAGVRLCWCPAGRFRMGSPVTEPERTADEGPVQVTLTRGFWMGKFEVTQGEWKRVMGPLPRAQNLGAGDDVPVYWVNFSDCAAFCARATELARKAGELTADWEFALPTEAQWEFACRAGSTTASHYGDSLSGRQANIDLPYNGGEPAPARAESVIVGSFAPNAWGLHDMHGNVWEWTRDWYHSDLPGGVDPDLSGVKGTPNRDGTYSKVRRGGAWIESGRDSRSARRLRYEPERTSDHIGFRVAVVRRQTGV